jgi:serine/threonine protein kinase
MYDFVKVLDFGLVKSLDGQDKANVTSPNALMGTPLYLSPEAINEPDKVSAQTDVYSIGAVGYFLLTGTPVFTGASIMEICMKHVKAPPEPPSVRLGKPVSPDLEALLLRCLAKAPSDRPSDAAHLLRELEKCVVEGSWTSADAAAWWAALEESPTVTGQTAQRAQGQSTRNVETPGPETTMAYEVKK